MGTASASQTGWGWLRPGLEWRRWRGVIAFWVTESRIL